MEWFLIYQYLIYQLLILPLLNQPLANFDVSLMLRFCPHSPFWFRKVFTHICYVFFVNPTVKRIIIGFPFNICFITFCLYYFFNFKLFLIYFLQFFFVKLSNNFFTVNVTNTLCPQHQIFNILQLTKTSSDQFGVQPFTKMFLYFDVLT